MEAHFRSYFENNKGQLAGKQPSFGIFQNMERAYPKYGTRSKVYNRKNAVADTVRVAYREKMRFHASV